MPSAEYHRRQAEMCMRMARAFSNEDASRRMLVLAAEHEAKAIEMEGRSQPVPPQAAGQGNAPDGEESRG